MSEVKETVEECPLSSDGKHHLVDGICVYCEHGRYYHGRKFDDLSLIDLLALREQAQRNPELVRVELSQIDQELINRGYQD